MLRILLTLLLTARSLQQLIPDFDLLITNGTIYDGNGGEPFQADIAVVNDRIVAIGALNGLAKQTIDAAGYAVAPGFINMLSWATESLAIDGRSQSDIRQGVTLEVFGEGNSEGPINETMRQDIIDSGGFGGADVSWTTLDEYLQFLIDRGISTNIASFIGATTVRKTKSVMRIGAHCGRTGKDAGTGQAGDGRWRPGPRLFADLCTCFLCQDRRADSAGESGRRVRRNVHLPFTQRGQPAAGSN